MTDGPFDRELAELFRPDGSWLQAVVEFENSPMEPADEDRLRASAQAAGRNDVGEVIRHMKGVRRWRELPVEEHPEDCRCADVCADLHKANSRPHQPWLDDLLDKYRNEEE